MDHSLPPNLRPLTIFIQTEDWCIWRPQITSHTRSSFLLILFMYLNRCSLGYSHQMHILLLGEFPGERQSESITTAFFITTQTISCSTTQSKLADSYTEQSSYKLVLIIILSTYKICFYFKALFKQRGPNWFCPGVAVFDRWRIVKQAVLKTPFCTSFVFLFLHPNLEWFHFCSSILFFHFVGWYVATSTTHHCDVFQGVTVKAWAETSCIWITCRLELNSPPFF